MTDKDILALLTEETETGSNRVTSEEALSANMVGLKMFDPPIIGVASAQDPIFKEFQSPDIIGAHFVPPGEWLDGALSVISIFFPFTGEVKKSNAAAKGQPSYEWLHARIEGQVFMGHAAQKAAQFIQDETGCKAMVPSLSKRFQSGLPGKTPYTSNWSERHCAFACGLGTFGLSKGIITEKGMAGRFSSIITAAALEPHARKYTQFDEYCTKCGKCIHNCPVNAISLEKGKEHPPCDHFLDEVRARYTPRYGCGKCQVDVPCESRIPPKAS